MAEMLTGGHPNGLGRTGEVIDAVLADDSRLPELFACLRSTDATVRMRAGDALEKVCRERPGFLLPLADDVLGEMAAIDQPSVRWHTAQILDHLRAELTASQRTLALDFLKRTIEESSDWIVLATTAQVLGEWAGGDLELTRWLRPRLERMATDERKSVAKRAERTLAALSDGEQSCR